MRISIYGGGAGQTAALRGLLEACGAEVWLAPEVSHCDLLLCLEPGAVPAGRCGVLLLAGGVGAPAGVQARCAVSCGLSDRDTLTLSGLRGGRAALSLQRELVDLHGVVVEPGEFIVAAGAEPELLLLAAGALLALGTPPERLGERLENLRC